MRRISFTLAGGATMTCSAMGFGCAKLTYHQGGTQAIGLLEEAFARGITHFDVARLYGGGEAEYILGTFLKGKRDRVTVATKFGLGPVARRAFTRRAKSVARALVGAFPGLQRRGRIAGSSVEAKPATDSLVWATGATSMPARDPARFSPSNAARSLETSLRELRTDYVDILLLHECSTADAKQHGLVDFLDRQVAAGKVRCYGVATAFQNFCGPAQIPKAHRIFQFEDHPLVANMHGFPRDGGSTVLPISHSVLRPVPVLMDSFRRDPRLAARFSAVVGPEPMCPASLSGHLLHYALSTNPCGIVLTSTTQLGNLALNISVSERGVLAPAALSTWHALTAEIRSSYAKPAATL